MTYSNLKQSLGRIPVSVVEIDTDTCTLTYGNSPCTAAVGVTGSQKCFNTFKTCQDAANFNKGTKTFRFMTQSAKVPVGVNVFPCVEKINHVPTKIDIDGLSVRATVRITMFDFPHHDRGVDPYVDERSYDPSTQGTFWGKFKARNPYTVGRTIRVKHGFISPDGFDTSFNTDFDSREYIIQTIDGPDSNGKVTITAKDVLNLASNEKAKAPVQSTGVLNADITDVATSMTLDDASDYPTSGLVRVGDELISYTGKSTNTLTGLTRGENNTVADSHDADDEVQLCLKYDTETVPDVIEDLLVTYAGIDSSYIDKPTWDAEAAYASIDLFTIITEPTGVTDLLKELTEQTSSNLWWDDREQTIKLKPIRTPLASDIITTLTSDDIIEGTVKVVEERNMQKTTIVFRYGIFDYTKDIDENTNYRNTYLTTDTDTTGANQYNQDTQYFIYSRWLNDDVTSQGIADRMLTRLKEVPKRVTFQVDAKNNSLATGDVLYLRVREIQDSSGANATGLYIVTEEKLIGTGDKSQYTCIEFNTGLSGSAVARLIADNAQVDYTSATADEQATYMFISNASGQQSNGDTGGRIA